MAATLPSCECIGSYPPKQKLAFIYGRLRELSEDETLPILDCTIGESENVIMNRIYCAALAWANT